MYSNEKSWKQLAPETAELWLYGAENALAQVKHKKFSFFRGSWEFGDAQWLLGYT